MLFKFDVRLTDKDYFDFNKFWMLKSLYGKKQMLKLRAAVAAIFALVLLFFLWSDGFTAETFIEFAPYGTALLLFQVLWHPICTWTLKMHIKGLKKTGKMGYSPVSCMEFSEERFTETTPESKSEQVYSVIENVSVLADGNVYLHANNIMAYILPASCFDSEAERREFLAFIETKGARVTVYR